MPEAASSPRDASRVVVTASEMRAMDAWTIEHGVPGHRLMERAGSGAVRVLRPLMRGRRGPVVIVCGKGNNGGDGLVMARLLRGARRRVEVWMVGDPDAVRGDAARALTGWRRGRGRVHVVAAQADVERLAKRVGGAAIVVDALLGTGLGTPVVGVVAAVVDAINAADVPVLAVDMPSGVSADTGAVLGTAVRAQATASFAFRKVGQYQHPGVQLCGALTIVDIGIPREAVDAVGPTGAVLDAEAVRSLVPRRPPDAHKGFAGHVLVVAGGPGKVGAALLAAEGAARAGAGLTTLAVPASLQARVDGRVPEVMTTALPEDAEGHAAAMHEAAVSPWVEPYRAIVCGPGLGTSGATAALVAQLLRAAHCPVVLDADGLNVVAATRALGQREAPTIVTPHPGEMARLMGSTSAGVQADRVGAARRLARRDGAVVVLKGAGTVVAAPDGRYDLAVAGNPGMASGGMGDVLAGIVGGLVAQGLGPFDAARLGVHVHAAAADAVAAERGQIGLLARDVLAALPPTLAALAREQAEEAGG